jgi:hypothetical protein
MARVLLVNENDAHDVFELVELSEALARVRSAYLYEIGEELRLRVEDAGTSTDVVARVRAHTGPATARVTELELSR